MPETDDLKKLFEENLEVGDVLKLKVLRKKKEFEVKVKLAERR